MSVISESASVASAATETMNATTAIAAVKHMELADIFKLLKVYTAEAEKRAKSDAKGATKKRVPKEKKEKKPVPTQLRKNHAWVAFTLKHAQENGWEEFVITKAKSGEEILMPASTTHEGAHIYEDSINDKTPKGRQINRSEAMSLAKVRKDANHSSWEEFEAQFVPDEESSASESSDESKSTTSSKKSVTRKTAAEKEREKEEKKAAKEKEKAEKKAEKEAAAAAKKAEKEAEKAKKAAEKTEKKPATKTSPAPAPKKAAGGAGAKASDTEAEDKPAKAVKKITVKKVEDASEKIPTVADDGQAHLVTWKGKSYYMMASGEAWIQNKDKSMGKWVGMFDETKNILDETVEEPTFDEE
jgi:hypothetical protein